MFLFFQTEPATGKNFGLCSEYTYQNSREDNHIIENYNNIIID